MTYHECPGCGREAEQGLSHNWFPLYRCNDCGAVLCHDRKCGGPNAVCPACRSDNTTRSALSVYARRG